MLKGYFVCLVHDDKTTVYMTSKNKLLPAIGKQQKISAAVSHVKSKRGFN